MNGDAKNEPRSTAYKAYVPAQLVRSEFPGVAVTARVSVQHHARASTTLVLDEHEPDAMGASSQAWGGAGEGF